jgi:hypothetical protein
MEALNGFREKILTETAIPSFHESIPNAINGGINSIVMFFNLTKAHDITNHGILLTELNSYGITGITNLWFKSYLTCQKKS